MFVYLLEKISKWYSFISNGHWFMESTFEYCVKSKDIILARDVN
jgi:hypothetical protein